MSDDKKKKTESEEEKIDTKNINNKIEIDPELEEALSRQQRRKKAITMRKNKSKIAAGRRRNKNRKASPEKLKKRARKAAISAVRKKVASSKGDSYNDLSPSQKEMVDKKVEKRKSLVNRLSKKMLPIVRKKEKERKMKKESIDFEFENFLEEKVDGRKFHQARDKEGRVKTDKRLKPFRHLRKNKEDVSEGYKVLPKIDTSRYTKMKGLEGPFRTRSGKVLYYDNKEGRYYDRDTDMYLSHEDYAAYDDYPKNFREELDQLSSEIAESVRLAESKVEKSLKEKSKESGISYSILKEVFDRGIGAYKTNPGSVRPSVNSKEQWAFARVNSFINGGKTRKTADADLWEKHSKGVNEELEFLNEKETNKSKAIKSALMVIDKMVKKRKDLSSLNSYAYDVARSYNIGMTARELAKMYKDVYGDPEERKSSLEVRQRLMKKYPQFFKENAGDTGTDELTDKYLEDTPGENKAEFIKRIRRNLKEEKQCGLVSFKQLKAFERYVDKMFEKYDIDFRITKHFADRFSDSRNNPCITPKELASFMMKIYKMKGARLKKKADLEAVLKDLETDLNIPVKVNFDVKSGEFEVVTQTIMRKKNFRTPDPILRYK